MLDRPILRGPELLGKSPALEKLRRTVQVVAQAPCHATVCGETGTGKELIARCIHRWSGDQDRRFVLIDCRLRPLERLEHELFGGNRPGATLGGSKPHDPRTIFLEDVDRLPQPLQATLARVLQDDLGGSCENFDMAPGSVRIVASSRANLAELCEQARFLPELYYAVCGAQIRTVPLREMREDIPVLFEAFLADLAGRHGKQVPPAYDFLMPRFFAHSWPGNARELKNLAEKLIFGLIERSHDNEDGKPCGNSLAAQVDQFERHLILHYLRLHRGSVTAISEILAIPKTTLYDKLHRYRITAEFFKGRPETVQ